MAPYTALLHYERVSSEQVVAHVEALAGQLGTKDAIRLLAYQVAHLSLAIQRLGGSDVTAPIDQIRPGGSA